MWYLNWDAGDKDEKKKLYGTYCMPVTPYVRESTLSDFKKLGIIPAKKQNDHGLKTKQKYKRI